MSICTLPSPAVSFFAIAVSILIPAVIASILYVIIKFGLKVFAYIFFIGLAIYFLIQVRPVIMESMQRDCGQGISIVDFEYYENGTCLLDNSLIADTERCSSLLNGCDCGTADADGVIRGTAEKSY